MITRRPGRWRLRQDTAQHTPRGDDASPQHRALHVCLAPRKRQETGRRVGAGQCLRILNHPFSCVLNQPPAPSPAPPCVDTATTTPSGQVAPFVSMQGGSGEGIGWRFKQHAAGRTRIERSLVRRTNDDPWTPTLLVPIPHLAYLICAAEHVPLVLFALPRLQPLVGTT